MSRAAVILVLSAEQSWASAVRMIDAARPQWAIIIREEAWAPKPLLYAFLPREILSVNPTAGEAGRSLRVALQLQEFDASPTDVPEEGSPTIPQRPGGAPSRRTIAMDADGKPVAVTEGVLARKRELATSSLDALTNGSTPVTDTIDVRLGVQAPKALSVGNDDLIDVIAALASDALTIPGAVSAAASTKEPIAALLSIFGDAVVATGPRVLKLNPPTAGKRSQNAFEIRAVAPGIAQLAIIFRQGGTELANIRHSIPVTLGRVAPDRVAGAVPAAPRVEGDSGVLFIQIEPLWNGTEIRYQYQVQSAPLDLDFKRYESARLLDENGGAAQSQLDFVRRIYANMTNKVLRTPEQTRRFSEETEAFAEDLGKQLFPQELLKRLWDGRDKIECVRIMSWEPFIPWELVKLALPGEKKTDDRFFGEYGMVRWLAGRPAPRRLELANWSYLAATYPNNPANNVIREVDYFKSELPKHGIEPKQVPSTYDALLEALERPDFDVFHIACHGDVQEDNIEKAEILITDELVEGRPRFVSVSANVFGRVARLEERRPLVFINACEAGRLGASLTTWGGWPKRLIESGAGAVVGASWPVRDIASNKFATAFYDSLINGNTLSQAATDARKASAMGDASWMAFKIFGDPHARR